MIVYAAMLLPLVVGVLLSLTARRITRALSPSWSVPLLCTASVVTALATGFSLSVVAFTFLAQVRQVAAAGHWTVSVVRKIDPMPPALGIAAILLVTWLAVAAVLCLGRNAFHLLLTRRAVRGLGPGTQGLVVVDDVRPDAYALPGGAGRVIVSTAMLRALSAPERRAMLAHETSHLRRRHYLYRLAADLGAAADPLLRPVAAAVRVGVERWADEDAAVEIGDRRLVARALARASQAKGAPPELVAALALHIAGSDLGFRARALVAKPPRPRRVLAAGLAAVCLGLAASGLLVAYDTHASFERAQALSSAIHHHRVAPFRSPPTVVVVDETFTRVRVAVS